MEVIEGLGGTDLGADHPGPLVPDVLQRRGDVDLFHTCRATGNIHKNYGGKINNLY